jgi:hypothetical protein
MIDKPDPKDAGRTDPGGKRPHATLDLKATEVKPAQPAQGTGSPASAASSSASAAAASATPSSAAPGTSSSAASASADKKPDPSSSAAKPGSTASADSKPASTSKPSSPPKPEIPFEPQKRSGGGFFSHLVAGIVGGGLVYAAGALGLSQMLTPGDGSPDLSERVAALEARPHESSNADDLARRLDEAEGRLVRLGEIEQRLANLSDAQNALQSEAKALGEAAKGGGDAASAERVAKLEEQLRLISSGAPDAEGRIPQLAALAGKITDLEAALQNQIASLRKSIPTEIDERLSATAEASEAAKAATQRLDRDLAAARTEQARGLQKVETQKADIDRLSASVEAVREETGRLSSSVADLKSSVDSQLKAVARPADVSNAVSPVYSKIAEIEQNVQGVMKSEQSRRENAERIVLSLELSNLKRALDRGEGQGYAAELEEVRKTSAGQIDLSALERFKDTGVATETQLKAEFRPVMNAVLDADLEPADGSVIDRLLAGAKSVVRVRKVSHDAADTSTEAIVARIETALNDGRLGDVIALAKTLPPKAQAPIEDWLIKVTARHSVDQATAQIEDRLKASLSGAPDPAPASPAPAQN